MIRASILPSILHSSATFECDACGCKCKGWAVKYKRTNLMRPVQCPKCGSRHTMPIGSFRDKYKRVWEEYDAIGKPDTQEQPPVLYDPYLINDLLTDSPSDKGWLLDEEEEKTTKKESFLDGCLVALILPFALLWLGIDALLNRK